jgi:hypothetical protein
MYLGRNYLYFNKTNKKSCSYIVGDTITILYDSREGSLNFLINEIDHGTFI